MPLSIQVTRTPFTTSTARPVGSSAPQVEPAVSEKLSGMGAAVPGTPSIAASPSYSGRPPGVRTVAVTVWLVLTMKIRTRVSPSPPGNQAALDRKRRDRRQDVAAVLLRRHLGLVDPDLAEQVVDVDARPRGARDDRHLARERVGAADAVDLPLVGRAHHREQDAVACGDVVGQIAGEEVGALRGPAAHHETGNRGLHLSQSGLMV